MWFYALLPPIYQCLCGVMLCYTPYMWCCALLHPIYQCLYNVMLCYTPYINITPFYAVLHPILGQKLQCCVVLHLIYLCYIVLCNVSPCFAAEIHCYTNDMWCYAVLHLIYHTVVGIIHPVQLCLEREIQTHLLAEGRFA